MRSTGGFRTSEAPNGPEAEAADQTDHDRKRGQRELGLPRDKAAPRLEQRRDRVDGGNPVNPALQQIERNVDRGEEEEQENGHLHHGRSLLGAEPHRDACCPERPREVEQEGKRVETEQIDAVAADLHACKQRDDRDDRGNGEPANESRDRVAEQDAAAIRRGDHQATHEAALEVARDPEPGENARERRRLQQHEHELKRRVARRGVEARYLRDARKTSDERGEEEEWKGERGQQERRIREEHVQHAPRHAARYGKDVCHVRSSRRQSAWVASTKPTRLRPPAAAKPSPSASQFQPSITSERTASIRYETGLTVATHRNQSASIRLRGMFIDDRKRNTKKTGKRPCTASVEPVRSAAQLPSAAKPSAMTSSRRSSIAAPPNPLASRTPNARPIVR